MGRVHNEAVIGEVEPVFALAGIEGRFITGRLLYQHAVIGTHLTGFLCSLARRMGRRGAGAPQAPCNDVQWA